jgi:hypothetical protein
MKKTLEERIALAEEQGMNAGLLSDSTYLTNPYPEGTQLAAVWDEYYSIGRDTALANRMPAKEYRRLERAQGDNKPGLKLNG